MEREKSGRKMRNSFLIVVGLLLSVTIAETSFLIKMDSGLERLVVGIDERITGKDVLRSLTNGTTTYSCHSILENLKALLQTTSEILFKTTHRQTYFRQISILLPSHWANFNCTGNQEISGASYETNNLADFRMIPDHPVYNDKPWTLQYGPCGVPAKRISIPFSFVGGSSSNLGVRGRLLVREWIKSRYGVFDENGFAHDERYPAEFNQNGGESIKVTATACHLNRTCTNSSRCELERNTQKTSLMSLPLEGEGYELCNEKTHIRTTPTKHNFLCDGQSIWEVMQGHADFVHQTSHQGDSRSDAHESGIFHPPAIQFSYKTVSSHRMIFLLDRSRTMNQNNRWANLRQTLYRLFHYIPSGVELGLISYTNSTTISLPLSITSTYNRDHLHGRIPLKPLKESTSSCISCAVREALKLIKTEVVGPTTLVLLNGSPPEELMQELGKVNELVGQKPIRLILITYAQDFETWTTLPPYAQLYRIPETQFLSNLEQNHIMNDVFLQIVSDAISSPLIKVHQTLKWPNKEWQTQGQFMMEENLGRSTWVTVSTEETGDVDGLQLISPSGKEYDLPRHTEGLVFIKIPGIAEGGIWKYIINFYRSQAPRPISIDVITESRKLETVAVQFWTHVVRPKLNSTETTEVVRIYAEVLQGDLPVLNANVTATITTPSKFHEQTSFTIRLLDTGSGDPDITAGDGIYSAYFTQLGSNPGFFTVSGHADDNRSQAVVPIHTNITRGHIGQASCCGSSVPHISTTPTGPFLRNVVSPSFQILNGIGFGEDPYPPSRITDLRIEKTLDSSSELKLSWTSPGGDFDKGKAARYEIRCYTTREALTNDNFGTLGILVHNSLTPAPEEYGTRQSCTVGVPWANEVFYYGIVSIDGAANRGKVSNLVSVLIKEQPTSTVNIIDAWEDDALVYNLTSYRSLSHQNDQTMFHAGATWFRGLSEIELYIIIGGTGTFLILISTFVLILVCVRRSKIKASESGPPAYQNIYVENGKSEHGGKMNESINCCWENEADSPQVSHQKQNELRPAYFNDNSSYIPASALCSPPGHDEGNSIYRDLYGPSNPHHPISHPDSSSVNSNHSKPSESGSTVPCHPIHGLSHFHNPDLRQFQNNPELKLNHSRTPSDDEDGGFRSHLNYTPDSKGGYYEYDYDSPSIGNGSSYGGCPSQNKRKTRHISFV